MNSLIFIFRAFTIRLFLRTDAGQIKKAMVGFHSLLGISSAENGEIKRPWKPFLPAAGKEVFHGL